ncbi:hypothetical protein [Nonomuraea sp. NPDC049725]|uniref:hypothetical protein n=1 Tax=Nonomuraea sp. NPDC049725 TaxID=3154508 RepID=UPI003418366B
MALEELVRARRELPGYTTLDELTKTIRTEVNRGFFTLVASRVDVAARTRLARLLVVDPITGRSDYDGLKDVAQAASLGKFKGRLVFLQNLDALGPTEAWLEDVPPGKVAHFAGEARVTDVADLRKVLDEDKRLTLIVSLLHTVRTGVRDDVVTMFCKRMAAISWRRCARCIVLSPNGFWACSATSWTASARRSTPTSRKVRRVSRPRRTCQPAPAVTGRRWPNERAVWC